MPTTTVPNALGTMRVSVPLSAMDVGLLEQLTRVANGSEGREGEPWTPAEYAALLLSETLQVEYIEMRRGRRARTAARQGGRRRRFERRPEFVEADTGASPD